MIKKLLFMKLKSLKQANVYHKKVLLRVDFNLPIQRGKITDERKIRAVAPTIKYLLKEKAKVILISHLGRPNGKKISKYSLRPIARHLRIKFNSDCYGKKVKQAIDKLNWGEVILLENLRFWPGEETNNLFFAKQLSNLADLYVNDAFSVCHRLHASVVGITKFLPSYAGLLLIKEVNSLDQVLNYPAHPLVILMGGAKINTKLNILTRFLSVADHILLAGGLANNFFLARGAQIGRSIKQTELLSSTKKLLNQPNIILPIDCRIGNLTVKNKLVKTVHLNSKKQKICSSTEAILDVGPATRQLFAKYIKKAKMIIWNGPLGLFEDKRYAQGTKKVWQIIAKQSKAKIIIGGGDTLACLPKRISQKNIFLSLGGGAMLKFLAGQSMPGLTPLIKNIK